MPRAGLNCFKRASDGRWCAALHHEGRRLVYYGKTRNEALGKRKQAQADIDKGLMLGGDRQTVGAYLNDWLEKIVKTERSKVYEHSKGVIRRHFDPIKNYPLGKLNGQHLRAWMSDKLAEGYAAGTVRHMHAILRSALSQAVRDRILSENVAKFASAPGGKAPEQNAYSTEEARAFLVAIRGHDLEALFALTLLFGLRKSEVLRLMWADVDLDAGMLQVRGTKTAGSRRSLPLPAVLVAHLRAHKASQQRQALERAREWKPEGPVWIGPRGTVWAPNSLNLQLDRITEAAGLRRLKFHELRHSAATVQLESGTDIKIVSAILGHSGTRITMDLYQHVLKDKKREAVEGVAERLFGSPPSSP